MYNAEQMYFTSKNNKSYNANILLTSNNLKSPKKEKKDYPMIFPLATFLVSF